MIIRKFARSSAGLVALAGWLAAGPADAQPQRASSASKNRFEISFFGGHSFLDAGVEPRDFRERFRGRQSRFPVFGTLTSRLSQGFEVGARFGYRVTERVSIEAAYRYSPNNALELGLDFDRGLPIPLPLPLGGLEGLDIGSLPLPVPIPELEIPVGGDAHGIDANLLFYFTSGRIRPFATGGLGAEILSIAGNDRTHFAWNLGGGVFAELREGLGLRFDVRQKFLSDFVLTSETETATTIQYAIVLGF